MAAKTVNKVLKKPAKTAKTDKKEKLIQKSAGKKKPEKTEESLKYRWEMAGLFVIALGIITTISLLSHFVQQGKGNILGLYLGTWLASNLNFFNGSLPSVLFIVTLIILGIKLIQFRPDNFSFKVPLVFAGLYTLTSVMLSIKNITKMKPTFADFSETGGYIGNYIVHEALLPVFGKTVFGPYLVCGILMFFVVIWGFKLRISQVIEKSTEMAGILILPVFDAFDTLKLKRQKKHLKLQEKIIGPLLLTAPAAKKSSESSELKKNQRVKDKVQEIFVSTSKDITYQEDIQIEIPPELTDPLEIRKYRDRQKEIRRISELNKWELEQSELMIDGMLSKKANKKSSQSKPKIKSPSSGPEEEAVLEKVTGLVDDEEIECEIVKVVPEDKIGNQLSDEDVDDEFTELDEEDDDMALDEQGEADEIDSEPVPEPKPEIKYDEYIVPAISSVLDVPPEQDIDYTEEELIAQGKILEEQLANFKVMGKVVGICSGPVIIRYEVELAPGVKVNRISGLSDDLAMALKAKSIRILAPIPGKSAVGIEVPNRSPQIVYIRDILDSPPFNNEPDTIKLVLGKDIAGEPCVMDLTKAPHLLIAGQTGSGKSVCINSFMTSILFSKTPDEVRMILVDPKVVELKPYNAIPHLLAPVVTQPEVAVQALKWATIEMDKRYGLLAKAGVRNIKGFNYKFRNGKLEGKIKKEDNILMPYIIIVIDELADLMMVAGKEVETNIARIAQKARAVGLHLILATQRPSTNVITGTIKANLPTRVAFQVASQIDARTIMDKAGCEKLLGKGDMLFRSIDSPDPERIHGSFIDDDQTERLAKACSEQFVNYPHIPTFDTGEDDILLGQEEDIPRDTKFRDAAELLVSLKQASVSLLQRRMSIGYARAGRIMDQLERAGIVGKDRGSKPREVMMDELELNAFLSSGLNG